MADTPFKEIQIPFDRTAQPAAALGYPAPLNRTPWTRALKSQDTILAGRRPLLAYNGGGSLEWQVGSGASSGASQVYPDPELWRVVAESHATLCAGSCLELRALALPSGGTETYTSALGTWEQHGPSASIRLVATYTDANLNIQTVTVEKAIPKSSPAADGAEPTEASASWPNVLHVFVPAIKPGPDTPTTIAERSEWPRVRLQLAFRGGARVISANVCEVPDVHVVADTAEDVTAHGMPPMLGIPFKIPQTSGPPGASWEDFRFGTVSV